MPFFAHIAIPVLGFRVWNSMRLTVFATILVSFLSMWPDIFNLIMWQCFDAGQWEYYSTFHSMSNWWAHAIPFSNLHAWIDHLVHGDTGKWTIWAWVIEIGFDVLFIYIIWIKKLLNRGRK